MPQSISGGVLDQFMKLSPDGQKTALSRMSEDAKKSLLGEIHARQAAPPPSTEFAGQYSEGSPADIRKKFLAGQITAEQAKEQGKKLSTWSPDAPRFVPPITPGSPPPQPQTGDSMTRELSAGGLAGRLTDEALNALMGGFSARGSENAQGQASWQIPPIIPGAIDAANAVFGGPMTGPPKPATGTGVVLGPPESPEQRAIREQRLKRRDELAAKDQAVMSGLIQATISPVTVAAPAVARGIGALIAPGTINPPTPEQTVAAPGAATNALTATIPTATALSATSRGLGLTSGRLAGESNVLLGDVTAPITGRPSPTSQINALNRAVPPSSTVRPKVRDAAINATATLATPGVPAFRAPQPVAKSIQGLWAKNVRELAGDVNNIPTRGSAADLYNAATPEMLGRMRERLGLSPREADTMGPLPIEAANLVLDEIHAPIKRVFEDYANVDLPETARTIANKLRAEGEGLPDRPIWDELADRVERARTAGAQGQLKIDANKIANKLYDKTVPGDQVNSIVSAAQAYRSLADLIREHTYKALEDRGASGLIDQGRLEAKAWDFRDGVYKTWAEAARGEAPAALRSWHEKLGVDAVRGVMHPGKATLYTAIKPSLIKTPFQRFNELLKKSAADVGSPEVSFIERYKLDLTPETLSVPEGYGGFTGGAPNKGFGGKAGAGIDPVTGLSTAAFDPYGIGNIQGVTPPTTVPGLEPPFSTRTLPAPPEGYRVIESIKPPKKRK